MLGAMFCLDRAPIRATVDTIDRLNLVQVFTEGAGTNGLLSFYCHSRDQAEALAAALNMPAEVKKVEAA